MFPVFRRTYCATRTAVVLCSDPDSKNMAARLPKGLRWEPVKCGDIQQERLKRGPQLHTGLQNSRCSMSSKKISDIVPPPVPSNFGLPLPSMKQCVHEVNSSAHFARFHIAVLSREAVKSGVHSVAPSISDDPRDGPLALSWTLLVYCYWRMYVRQLASRSTLTMRYLYQARGQFYFLGIEIFRRFHLGS